MLEIICNEIYQTAPNSIYRMNNDANYQETGFLRPSFGFASPLACPLVITSETYTSDGGALKSANLCKECEKHGWYENA